MTGKINHLIAMADVRSVALPSLTPCLSFLVMFKNVRRGGHKIQPQVNSYPFL